MNNKFAYYNHSLISNLLEYQDLTFTRDELREAFKEKKKAIFLSYTSNFDCGFDTGWYYTINDCGFSFFDKLSTKHKKNLNRCFKFVYCKEICFDEYKDKMMDIFRKSIKHYSHYDKTKDHFNYFPSDNSRIIGCFLKRDDVFIGFEIIDLCGDIVRLSFEKTDPEYSKYQASFALNHFILGNYFINSIAIRFVCNGSTTVLHDSNHNSFLIKNLGYRKAFCQLHMVYRSNWVKALILFLRFFKPLIKIFDGFSKIHMINGVLAMDSISRKQRKMFKNV